MDAIYSTLSAFIVGAVVSVLLGMKGRTMKWETEQPKTEPAARKQIHTGPFYLTVEVQPDGSVWQYMSYSTGKLVTRQFETCGEKWPREAIALAREALSELEAKLEIERETSIQERTADSGATQAGSGAA